jgi:hypothetical protein
MGPGTLNGVINPDKGKTIPADSDSLIRHQALWDAALAAHLNFQKNQRSKSESTV